MASWDLDIVTDRVFDDFVRDLSTIKRGTGRPSRVNAWTPVMDVHESEKEFVVNAELPGLKKEQVNVDVRENRLVISGETKKDQQYKDGNTHVQERRYGSFSRSISLPPNVKANDITAKFENGLLELKLPKSASTGKKITVN